MPRPDGRPNGQLRPLCSSAAPIPTPRLLSGPMGGAPGMQRQFRQLPASRRAAAGLGHRRIAMLPRATVENTFASVTVPADAPRKSSVSSAARCARRWPRWPSRAPLRIDCDVLRRTAAPDGGITGGCVALTKRMRLACQPSRCSVSLRRLGRRSRSGWSRGGAARPGLSRRPRRAVDANVVMLDPARSAQVQPSGRARLLHPRPARHPLDLAESGIAQLFAFRCSVGETAPGRHPEQRASSGKSPACSA